MKYAGSIILLGGCAALALSGNIPTTTLPSGTKLPMMYMGAGNLTDWAKLVGKGAGVKTAWGYHNQPSILPQVYAAGLKREDIFLESMVPCGFVDHPAPQNKSTAADFIRQDLQLLNTTYVDLIAIHHQCNTPEETAEVWSALGERALLRQFPFNIHTTLSVCTGNPIARGCA